MSVFIHLNLVTAEIQFIVSNIWKYIYIYLYICMHVYIVHADTQA